MVSVFFISLGACTSSELMVCIGTIQKQLSGGWCLVEGIVFNGARVDLPVVVDVNHLQPCTQSSETSGDGLRQVNEREGSSLSDSEIKNTFETCVENVIM